MARARTIKPGFFKNDELAELNPYARLLFAGLWTIADREGRIEDRPKRIKAEILPYDDLDVNELLDELHNHHFICRYEVDGKKYIWCIAFTHHQNPHKNEPESIIPPVPDDIAKNLEQYHINLDEDGSNPALTYNLDPDPDPEKEVVDITPYEEIKDSYNRICISFPRIRELTKKRRRALKSRWVKYKDIQSFVEVFNRAEASDFLSGRNGKWANCDFDWLIDENHMVSILEGKYNNRAQPGIVSRGKTSLQQWASSG